MTDRVQRRLEEKLHEHRFLLESTKSTFLASDHVSAEEFDTIASSLHIGEEFPAAAGIGLLRVEQSPNDTGSASTSQPRFAYYVAASPSGVQLADVEQATQVVREIEACLGAAGESISAPIELRGEVGFVWLTPVAKEAEDRSASSADPVSLWVYAPMLTSRLLGDLEERAEAELVVSVSDSTTGQALISPDDQPDVGEAIVESRGISVGGRRWTLTVRPSDRFRTASSNAPSTLAAGVGCAAALALLVRSQGAGRRRAEALAESVKSELTQRDAQLREAAERNELALAGGGLGLWDWDIPSGRVVYDSRTAAMIGETVESLKPSVEGFSERVHPDDVNLVFDVVEAHFRDPNQPYQAEFRFRHRDGTYRWVYSAGRVVERDAAGEPVRMTGTHADVTERVLATRASAEATRRARSLAQLVKGSPNELYLFNRDDLRFEEVNEGAVAATGYTREELLGMTPVDIKPDLDEAAFRLQIEPLARDEVGVLRFQTDHQRRDGTTYPVQVSLHASVFNDTPVYVAFVTDLTELRALERRLSQAQKLESIGQLAAGIAHEINTPMQCVASNVEFLAGCQSDLLRVVDECLGALDGPARDWDDRRAAIETILNVTRYKWTSSQVAGALDDAATASRRVIEIVRAMKAMAHPGSREKAVVDVNDVIRNAAAISRNRWKYAAELRLELDPSASPLPALSAELSQVFLNLLVNAADAIVERHGEDASRGRITVRTETERETLRIEVEDNGAGVPVAIRDRLFDPFFTTKEVGKGTGQGLAITYDVVVNKHGGAIDLLSTEGEGTTFVLHLPREEPSDDDACEITSITSTSPV